MVFSSVVQDAATAERDVDAEIYEARAADERAWLDNGGIDAMAAEYDAPVASDELPF